MQLQLEWNKPLSLADGSDEGLIYTCNLDKIPEGPGIYIFARRHGQRIEALYVGKADVLRNRIKSQLRSLPLMKYLEESKTGTRVILIGRFIGKGGQQQKKSLLLIERSFIKLFLLEGHDIANKQGTALKHHEISSTGAREPVPNLMFVER